MLKRGQSFLNIGSGTGYLSHLVGYVIGPHNRNHAVERIPALVHHARTRCAQVPELRAYNSIRFRQGDGFSLPTHEQYDRIYVGAGSTEEDALGFRRLLSLQGRMIIPVEGELLAITRDSETMFQSQVLTGVNFTKLVHVPISSRLIPSVDFRDESAFRSCTVSALGCIAVTDVPKQGE